MSYSIAIAEESKNAVLNGVQANILKVAAAGAKTVSNTMYYTIIAVLSFVLAFVIIILIFLVIVGIFTAKSGILIFGVLFIFTIAVGYIAISAAEDYAKRKFNLVALIYFNFVSSERLLEILDESAAVYLDNIPPT